MSNLNLQKLREWVWPWPWTSKHFPGPSLDQWKAGGWSQTMFLKVDITKIWCKKAWN